VDCFLTVPHTTARWYPTRLIDVGPLDGEVVPRLVETTGEVVRGDFTALSHMWRDMLSRPPLQTMQSNYEDMKAGLDYQTCQGTLLMHSCSLESWGYNISGLTPCV
jgi:hypothetical protein